MASRNEKENQFPNSAPMFFDDMNCRHSWQLCIERPMACMVIA